MQYISRCLNKECDHYWAGPRERNAYRKARDHSADTGHYVHHKGRYDAPVNGGIYKDGERVTLSQREFDALVRFGVEPTEHAGGDA